MEPLLKISLLYQTVEVGNAGSQPFSQAFHEYTEQLKDAQGLAVANWLDPKNPEVQNYLGITLSEKGQRGAAEAALRKSIQLAPRNPDAHHNLAVIYASQKPPSLELARWHYQKSVDAGHAKNPELEKILGEN